jgi:lipopolysaccharide/colanic/teichoic acid biosynthesis glycosyltransferase
VRQGSPDGAPGAGAPITLPAAKRTLDIALASTGLIVLAPVFAIIAIAVKVDSRGPVFFRQERVGRGGRLFRMIKFRTMVRDADRISANVSTSHDPRLTRVGAFLRRSFLDEAPQLLNVLKGDMSMVGPRPETPEFAALFTPDERRILAVRPGMAGPSTLAYSREEATLLARQADPGRYYREHLLHARASTDLRYLEQPSLTQDIQIMARTALFVVSGATAALRSRSGISAGGMSGAPGPAEPLSGAPASPARRSARGLLR